MAQTELLLIDDRTPTDDFADRVRWNQAYHRLARPL
jgi:L-arabinose isomerase